MSVRPLVAIPTYHLAAGRVRGWPTRSAFAVPEPYVSALRRAGVRPALLTAPGDGDAEEILGAFDGLVLIGGDDVDPALYGSDPSPTLCGPEPARDALEIELIRAADRMRVPTLAICRGIQVLNVAFGGTLHQHLPEVDGLIEHGTPGGGDPVRHDVDVEPGSRLRASVARPMLTCSSHHHQGIDRLGSGLEVSARTSDGLVEAVERKGERDGHAWMVGVQWHPEDTASDDPAQQLLFDGFAVAAGWRSRLSDT